MKIVPLHTEAQPDYQRRLDGLAPHAPARWGRLTPPRMLAHLRRSIELSLGERETPDLSNPLTRTILKHLALSRLPWPRGRIKSPPFFFPERTDDLDTERRRLSEAMRRFTRQARREPQRIVRSPIFGPMPLRRWSRLHGKHFDHHLRQFGL